MNKKKIIAVALCVCMAATAIVGGTLAYFTDTDSAKNVFTVGNVSIEQIEQQRDYGEDGKLKDKLVNFENDKVLMPIVGSAQGDKDKFGMPIAANYVDKIVTVKNTGKSDAWVRTFVATPKNLIDPNSPREDMSNNPLHSNIGNRFDAAGKREFNDMNVDDTISAWGWDYTNYKTFEAKIDNIDYIVDVYTYKTTLAANATTDAVITGYYLDNDVDYDPDYKDNNGETVGAYFIWNANGSKTYLTDFADKDGKVNILVATQAVQAAGFDTAEAAFNATFGEPSATNNPWLTTTGKYYATSTTTTDAE